MDTHAPPTPLEQSVSHRTALEIADILVGQSQLNASVAKALEAVALTADRYDAELAEIRDGMVSMLAMIDTLSSAINRLTQHTVNGATVGGEHA